MTKVIKKSKPSKKQKSSIKIELKEEVKVPCGCGNTKDPNGYCDGSHAK